MPIRIFFANKTPSQIAAEGLPAIHKQILDDALAGELAFLFDGREYFVRFRNRPPQPLEGSSGMMQIQLFVEWALGNFAQANLGEFVHGELLRPDHKGLDEEGNPNPGFEATRHGMVFHPEAGGWKRIS